MLDLVFDESNPCRFKCKLEFRVQWPIGVTGRSLRLLDYRTRRVTVGLLVWTSKEDEPKDEEGRVMV